VDIEVQIVNRHDFRKRGPYYWAKRHALKLKKGEKTTFAQIKPTITICLLAFDLLEEEEGYCNVYSIRNDKSGNRLCEDMQIIYLELPKFLRFLGADHPRTGLERWLLYFCNEEGERMEKVMTEDSVLSMAKELELEFWADEAERESYFQHQQLLMDAYSDEHTYEYLLQQAKEKFAAEFAAELEVKLEAEREKAAAEVEAKLEAEREKAATEVEAERKKAKRETALSMLADGVPIDMIAKYTGMSVKEVNALQSPPAGL
jgi:hypothetical protein